MNWNLPDKRIVVGLLLLMLEKTECLMQERTATVYVFLGILNLGA